MQKPPLTAVSEDFLDFEKTGNNMPVIIATGSQEPEGVELIYINCMERLRSLTRNGPDESLAMPDCDGDALWVRKRSIFYGFPNLVDEGMLKDLSWGKSKIKADGQKLLTTALLDTQGYPLGVAYSSQQSARENFIPKEIGGKIGNTNGCDGSENVVTLRSRSRGIWPKGLKNPNTAPDDPLPERLDESSGNFLVFKAMYTTREGDALLIQAEVPDGHGFCHESYLYEENIQSFRVYENDSYAPIGAIPYRSCFHRVLVRGISEI